MTVRVFGRHHGFTLLEILVAIAITAVIGLGVWQITRGVIEARDRVDTLAGEFDQLQRLMLLFERDLAQVINRPVRVANGEFEPALVFREPGSLQLTRQGWRNPLGLRRSRLQRVEWQYRGQSIRRVYWPVTDRASQEGYREDRLLGDVQGFRLRLLDQSGVWHDTWPARTGPTTGDDLSAVAGPLPRAMELVLRHQRFGTLERVFVMPDYEIPELAGTIRAGKGKLATEPSASGEAE